MGGDFSLLLLVETGPGVHSASLMPWLCICGSLHPHPPWAFEAFNRDTLVSEFTVEDLPLNRTATLVLAFAVKDVPSGRSDDILI